MGTDKFHTDLLSLQSNMLNFAMMLTSDRDNAYDLLQDTTLKALSNRDKFCEGSNFKGWIFTIMRNIFINNYRRSARAATVVDTTENLYHLNMSQESGLEAPEESYTTLEINEGINNLPEALRTPFTLFVTGYKYNEISDRMSLPVGTIKSRIHMARKRLQTQFADYNC